MGRLFGTDGVRGIANQSLTCELAMSIGRAAAAVLSVQDGRRKRIVVGIDTRESSEMLCCALTSGICSMGADVYLLGVIPTPAVAFLASKYNADAGVMISASHNSAEFNGIKLFSGEGYKLPDDIEEQVEAMATGAVPFPETCTYGRIGRVIMKESAVKDYIKHLKDTIPISLEGMSVAVDCANGAASATAEMLFGELGADCRMLNDRPNGFNINENCGSLHPQMLSEYVRENMLDAGVAFDGDADRCIFVDGEGNTVDGDGIMAICALDLLRRGKLNQQTVVCTVMSNLGLVRFCEKNGLRLLATKVGDRYVLEKMLQEDCCFGGEQSGHIIFRDYATTGDGQLAAIQLLSILRRERIPLERAAGMMKKYPQRMINVAVSQEGKIRFYMDDEIKRQIDAESARLKDGRVIVRPSGTEPLIRVMTEGRDEQLVQSAAENIARVIAARLADK